MKPVHPLIPSKVQTEYGIVPFSVVAPCGNVAYFEDGPGYRCSACFAVLGSVGMPDECRSLPSDRK
jgi:hypothetical protein